MKRIALVLMIAAACGSKDKGDKGKGGDKGGGGTADAKAANDAVPAAWKSKITFEVKTLGGEKHQSEDKMSVPVPKGWPNGFLEGSVEPPKESTDFGFATSMRVGATCQGECKAKSAKEWEAAANEAFFDNLAKGTPAPKITKDDKKDGRRTMIAVDQHTDGNMNQTHIVVAWWKDGAENFHFCSADLAEEAKDLAPAFEAACQAAVEQ